MEKDDYKVSAGAQTLPGTRVREWLGSLQSGVRRAKGTSLRGECLQGRDKPVGMGTPNDLGSQSVSSQVTEWTVGANKVFGLREN